jgi:uncharacterized protein (DUF2342 family)
MAYMAALFLNILAQLLPFNRGRERYYVVKEFNDHLSSCQIMKQNHRVIAEADYLP